MKRALVLVAIAALLVGVIPFADSSDAAGETTISGYFKGGDVSSSTKITIAIIYSEDLGNTGTLVGITESINPPDNTGKNKFSVTITPGTSYEMDHYYLYIEILGYKVTRLANDNYERKETPISVTDPRTSTTSDYYNCYKLCGTDIVADSDNPLGSESYCFEIESTKGTITGKVIKNTKEPVYITGVKVSLVDKKTKEVLATDTTNNDGYSFTYYTGTYDLLFEMSGYDSVTNEVVISADTETKLPDIVMKENQSYFGFDLSHAMMILGGSVAVVLLLFTIFMRTRLSK